MLLICYFPFRESHMAWKQFFRLQNMMRGQKQRLGDEPLSEASHQATSALLSTTKKENREPGLELGHQAPRRQANLDENHGKK